MATDMSLHIGPILILSNTDYIPEIHIIKPDEKIFNKQKSYDFLK